MLGGFSEVKNKIVLILFKNFVPVLVPLDFHKSLLFDEKIKVPFKLVKNEGADKLR